MFFVFLCHVLFLRNLLFFVFNVLCLFLINLLSFPHCIFSPLTFLQGREALVLLCHYAVKSSTNKKKKSMGKIWEIFGTPLYSLCGRVDLGAAESGAGKQRHF